MKCPKCSHNQQYKLGMTCGSCGYSFALNPKQPPHLTDMAMQKVIDRVSGNDEYYFTYNQLFGTLCRALRKKKMSALKAGIFALLFVGLIFTVILFANLGFLPASVFALSILGLSVWLWRRPVKIPYAQAVYVIHTYNSRHPVGRMVDGRTFAHLTGEEIDPEMIRYAPERILIVERNDIADMLILNRFHMENKTLVVSGEKYPRRAFAACQQFLLHHPGIPVDLLHDASRKGHRMRKRLLDDPEWNLGDKNVTDLGIHPGDLAQLKQPLWMPESGAQENVIRGGKPVENIRSGYKMPVDLVPPRSLMNGAALAMTAGFALLSLEFLEEQQRLSSGTFSGGGGGGADFDADFG